MKAKLMNGNEIEVISFINKILLFKSTQAFAPGAPIQMKVLSDDNIVLEGRSIGSKKNEDIFDVRMRMVTLRKKDRLFLEEVLEKE